LKNNWKRGGGFIKWGDLWSRIFAWEKDGCERERLMKVGGVSAGKRRGLQTVQIKREKL